MTTPYWFELGDTVPGMHKLPNPFSKLKLLRERFKTPKGYKDPPVCYESSPYQMWVTINFTPGEKTVKLYFKREQDMLLARLMV